MIHRSWLLWATLSATTWTCFFQTSSVLHNRSNLLIIWWPGLGLHLVVCLRWVFSFQASAIVSEAYNGGFFDVHCRHSMSIWYHTMEKHSCRSLSPRKSSLTLSNYACASKMRLKRWRPCYDYFKMRLKSSMLWWEYIHLSIILFLFIYEYVYQSHANPEIRIISMARLHRAFQQDINWSIWWWVHDDGYSLMVFICCNYMN